MNLRLVAGLCVAAGVIGACVIAEPPAELPSNPNVRPRIIRATAVPKTTSVFTGWPDLFKIDVQLSDPRQSFYATSFVDYNPSTGDGYQNNTFSTPSSGDSSSVRKISIAITQPSDDGCHTVEIVVANEFVEVQSGNGINAHTPKDRVNDGDSITWFYSPTGDLAGCPVLDAGLSPIAPIDGGDDAGEAGAVP